MARRRLSKRVREARLDSSWTRTPEYRANRRILTPGVEVRIRGERGRFRFVEHVRTDKGREWLAFVGGSEGVLMSRAFHVDRVQTVHRNRILLSGREALGLMAAKKAARKETR